MTQRCKTMAFFKRISIVKCFGFKCFGFECFGFVCLALSAINSANGRQPHLDESVIPTDQLAAVSLAICQAGDATTDLLQRFLERDIAVTRKPVLFRQTEIGTTVSVLSKPGDAPLLEVQLLSPPGRPPQSSVTSYLAPDANTEHSNAKPDARLALSNICSIRAAHQLIYDNGVALYITALDSDLQPVGEKQWLNPELPELSRASTTKPDTTEAGTAEPGTTKPDTTKPDLPRQNTPTQTENQTHTLRQNAISNNADQQHSITVGLVDSGVNYLLPEIYSGLATDNQGRLLGFDFWDMDDKPFDANPARSPFFVQRHGTRTASIVLREAPGVKIAPYRYPRNNMHRMADLIAHADANGIRVIGMPLGSNTYADWVAFDAAANEHPHILFIVSAGNNGRDIDRIGVYPAAMDIQNMLVVTSADDFVHPAERTNYGRISVDYMVPAEHIDAIDFNGDPIKVSGSSYAVARVLALAARLMSRVPDQPIEELKASIKDYAVRAQTSRFVAIGYLGDPLAPTDYSTLDITIDNYNPPKPDTDTDYTKSSTIQSTTPHTRQYTMPLQLVRLDSRWKYESLAQAIDNANRIYRQCNIELTVESAVSVGNAGYLSDLSSGHALTLSRALTEIKPTAATRVFLADDTIMLEQYDANAFGIGNTRNRPWMTNSLWLTHGIEDVDIALAHELFHIAGNNGEHSMLADNLMQSRTFVDNTSLTDEQCGEAVRQGTANGVLHQNQQQH